MVECRGHRQLQGPTLPAKGSKVGVLISMIPPISTPDDNTELFSSP